MSSGQGAAGSIWWLRCPHGDAPITHRDLLVGRDPSCHITLADPLVSRCHARFWLSDDYVFLEDLGSTNGTFVDEQLVRGRRLLGSGTRIRFGSLMVWIHEGASPPRGPRERTAPDIPARMEFEEADDLGPTNNTNVFSLVGPQVDAALRSGQVTEVLRILEPYMDQVLSDARARRHVDPEVARAAYTHALRLAEATRHGAWIDYVVELASNLRTVPLPNDVVRRLPALASQMDVVEQDWKALLR